ARLELDELERLVREGIIHPDLTLAGAKKLIRRRGRGNAGSKRPPVKAWIRRLKTFVGTTRDAWSLQQLKFASDNLREILLQIELTLANGGAFQSTASSPCSRQPLEIAA